MRILLPVTVSPSARFSISLIKADFPEPVGPTIDKVSPGLISIESNHSFSPNLFFPDSMVRVNSCVEKLCVMYSIVYTLIL